MTTAEARRLKAVKNLAAAHAMADRFLAAVKASRSRCRSRAPRVAPTAVSTVESHAERTARVRKEVWERACTSTSGIGLGVCECGCGRAIFWDTFQMDHWLGAARRGELTTAENCWALHRDCHTDKGGPDVAGWNARRVQFCMANGLVFVPRKPTRYYAETSR